MKKNTGYPSIDKTHLNGTKYSERHPIIPNFSIVKVMELLWAKCPDDAAVSCYELKATHKELLEDSQILAKVFKILGIQKGDIICISMPNYYQGVASFVAANRIGAIVTFLNPYAQDEELIVQMNKYESPLLINYDKTGEYNNNLIEQTKLKHIITIQKGDEGVRVFPVNEGRNTELKACLDYRDLARIAEKFGGVGKNDKSHVDGNDDALILFTSGSTGNPKMIQMVMENMRRKIWSEFDVKRDNINDINPSVYVNHTWLKKYGTPLFEFNSAKENKILRNADGRIPENEYFIDDDGVFKTGIIKKELT